jgi:hypothetical protein
MDSWAKWMRRNTKGRMEPRMEGRRTAHHQHMKEKGGGGLSLPTEHRRRMNPCLSMGEKSI